MTDLKALRREIAEKMVRKMLGDAVVEDDIEIATDGLLQYAEACLGEPSEGMAQACIYAPVGGRAGNLDFEMIKRYWTAMASRRLKELK